MKYTEAIGILEREGFSVVHHSKLNHGVVTTVMQRIAQGKYRERVVIFNEEWEGNKALGDGPEESDMEENAKTIEGILLEKALRYCP